MIPEIAMKATIAICACLAASLGLPAQQTWVVDFLNRPGTDFADIQPAVDAAAPGDVIRIRGTGDPTPLFPWGGYVAPTIDGKSLTLVGDGTDIAAGTFLEGILHVQNVPRGSVVRLMGFRLQSPWTGLGGWFRCLASEGLIVFDGVHVDGYTGWPYPGFDDCRIVLMSHVVFSAKPMGIDVVRSNVMFDDCTIASTIVPGNVDTPLCLDRSRVWLRNSTVIGQSYNPLSTPAQWSGAIDMQGTSELFLGPGTHLEGGMGPAGRASAVRNTYGVSLSHVDPGVTHLGSINGIVDARPVTTLRTTTTATTLTVDHSCTPSSLIALAAGPMLPTPWTAPEGLIAVDPAQAYAWFAFEPSGQRTWTFALPPGLPASFLIGLQGVEVRPDGTFGLTNVVTVGGS